MYDVVAFGELLIDFTPQKQLDGKTINFQKNAGGAPANVLAALAKIGKSTVLISKVGKDNFGSYLSELLESLGIVTKGIVFSETENTTLAFVELNESGDRSFTFYRKQGADKMLCENEIDYELISNSKIFHFGSMSLSYELSNKATIQALNYAKNHGVLISYDPNIRLPLWSDLQTARSTILSVMHYADILKISSEEMIFLIDEDDPEKGSKQFYEQFKIPLICVTMGDRGCYYRSGDLTGKVDAFSMETVDTTGAGDAFLGGLLGKLLDEQTQIKELNAQQLRDIVSFGNAMGSLATTRYGGIPSMPNISEVNKLLQR